MDHVVLFFILLLIWLTPFSFGYRDPDQDVLNTCLDAQNHKLKPGPESSLYKHCTPWKYRSCCNKETSELVHGSGHYNFNKNHCSNIKNLSSNCEKYFIRDACFYECSPNVGPWIVSVNSKSRNERFYGVPLCKSDCITWYEACKDDYTCSDNWGQGWDWSTGVNKCKMGSVCEPIKDKFKNAQNFCEKVWDGSWKVTPDSEPCMRLWFDSEEENPNDAVARHYAVKFGSTNGSAYKFSRENLKYLAVLALSHSIPVIFSY